MSYWTRLDKIFAVLDGISPGETASLIRQKFRETYPAICEHFNQHGIEFYGKTTPQFRRAMLDTYGKISEPVRKYLAEDKSRIAISAYKDEIRPDLKEHYDKSTQDDPREHQNQSAGMFYPDKKLSTVTQYNFDPYTKPPVGETPRLWPLMARKWTLRKIDRLRGVLRHEIGHAFDKSLGNVSATAQFNAIYQADVKNLDGPAGARAKGLGYFIQDKYPEHKTGQSEVFAELWAQQNGGGSGQHLAEHFPLCAAWIKDFRQRFEQAYREGPLAVNALLCEIRTPDEINAWIAEKFFQPDYVRGPLSIGTIRASIAHLGDERAAAHVDYLTTRNEYRARQILALGSETVWDKAKALMTARKGAFFADYVFDDLEKQKPSMLFRQAVEENNKYIDLNMVARLVDEVGIERSAQFAHEQHVYASRSNTYSRCLAGAIAQVPGVGVLMERIHADWLIREYRSELLLHMPRLDTDERIAMRARRLAREFVDHLQTAEVQLFPSKDDYESYQTAQASREKTFRAELEHDLKKRGVKDVTVTAKEGIVRIFAPKGSEPVLPHLAELGIEFQNNPTLRTFDTDGRDTTLFFMKHLAPESPYMQRLFPEHARAFASDDSLPLPARPLEKLAQTKQFAAPRAPKSP